MHKAKAQGHVACVARGLAFILALASLGASAATLVVNGTADASPPATSDGVCSLREAMQAIINAANFGDCLNSGGAYGTVDTINFNITGAGVHTINAVATLPVITKPMLIDGYSQPGASANTLAVGNDAQLTIEINGGSITDFTPLFQMLGGGGSTIRGLVMDNFGGHIIEIGFSVPSGNNTIAGNFLGVDPTGTSFVNGTNSVIVVQGASNTIGGTAPADRNVIAGQGGVNAGAIYVFGAGNNDNVIEGNYIGVNAAGTAALPAGGSVDAIELLSSSGNTIGGSAPGAGNVIVASNIAVRIDSSANYSVIQGNLIGTDATGTVGLAGAGATGIQIADTVSGTTIGGSAAGEGNVVSAGLIGIDLRSGTIQTTVLGNKIGTDVTGTLPLGNRQCGISVAPGGSGNAGIHVGGSGAGEGNVVAFNGTQGVQIADGTGTLVQHNSIFSNGGLGISFSSRCDLVATPTPNDPGDTDSGANNLENHPVITSAVLAAGKATVGGTIDVGTSDVVTIEVFANASCDPSGFGEGQILVGSTSFITGGTSPWSLANLSVPPGTTAMSATLTSGGNNTSEFSNCFAFPAPPVLASAVSRRVHGAAGTFDLPLSTVVPPNINHNPTTEPRQGPAQTIVFAFDKPVIAATVNVSEGTAIVAAPTFSGNEVSVDLTGVSDQQYVTVDLTNVNSADGGAGGTGSVRVGFLKGDVNGSRVVTVADLGLVNAQLAQPVTLSNYLKDVNASGTLTVADKGITNANLTKALPAP